MQNSPGPRSSVPVLLGPPATEARHAPLDLLAPTLWGASLFLVLSGIPLATTASASAVELLAVAPLALGLLWAQRRGPVLAAQVLLLTLYPAALGAMLSIRPNDEAADTLGPFGVLAALACLWAFVATTSGSLRAATHASMPRIEALPPPHGRSSAPPAHAQRLRALVIQLFAAAAVGIAVLAPLLGSRQDLEHAWGEAADEGRVLVAVASCSIACVLLATWLSTVLRAPSRTAPTRTTRSGALLHVSLALLGATTYYVLRAG